MAARRCVVRELVWLDPVANDGGNGRSRLDWSSDEINYRLEPSAVFEIEAAATGLVGSKCRELDFFLDGFFDVFSCRFVSRWGRYGRRDLEMVSDVFKLVEISGG